MWVQRNWRQRVQKILMSSAMKGSKETHRKMWRDTAAQEGWDFVFVVVFFF